jgi:hypothetical protein
LLNWWESWHRSRELRFELAEGPGGVPLLTISQVVMELAGEVGSPRYRVIGAAQEREGDRKSACELGTVETFDTCAEGDFRVAMVARSINNAVFELGVVGSVAGHSSAARINRGHRFTPALIGRGAARDGRAALKR